MKTNPVRLVIRDKSCQHYMSKSLLTVSVHMPCMLVCVCCEGDDISELRRCLWLISYRCLWDVAYTISKLHTHTHNRETCASYLQPPEPNVQHLRSLLPVNMMLNVIILKVSDWNLDTTNYIQVHQTTAMEKYTSRLLNSHEQSVHTSSYTVDYRFPVKKSEITPEGTLAALYVSDHCKWATHILPQC